ncbi:TetR/AcrR family transcriptional regulator [Amycolatopsis cihanbeyliensis]|uniref:TetR family transcriptional regulator n=1 Tax=Amycolatopsis cihanbeyliensis TaxID=1128664 RepID=A0A542DGM6_AMYCI|nr:TetR/AcrR family transcriptional regulator [Amycolatopsis cihanbeyliensis]TQJ02200.1 TetR family transcriptional regulator [Amycolatopsis cihanbeyliensis]
MPRRTRDPEGRRRIIAAAWRLVARQGAQATTMRGIAEEAGVSTGSVTHYFTDKAEVLGSVLRYNNRRAAERIGAACTGKRGLEAVAATAQALVPGDQDRLDTWTVWLAFWGHRPAHQNTAREGGEAGYGALRGWLRHGFTEAIADREIPTDADVEHELERLLVLIGGLGLMTGGSTALLGEVRQRSQRMLTEHLSALAGRLRTPGVTAG